jgi:hypothetical protein
MHTHSSSCLEGPVSGTRSWWQNGDVLGQATAKSALQEEQVRADLVAHVRREIAAGTYDTPEKWQAALDRLCASLEKQ